MKNSMRQKLKVLLISEQCNPNSSSVPLLGYKMYEEINRIAEVTLVTREKNKQYLKGIEDNKDIIYIQEGFWAKEYYPYAVGFTVDDDRKVIRQRLKSGQELSGTDKINWPLHHAVSYPVYAEFNHKIYQKLRKSVLRGDYDIVHVFTPMIPRYPFKIVKACKNTPFVIGPVNGGVPYPPGFQEVARQEFAQFNFLRALGRYLIPGYRETYKKADKILAGSTYTLNYLKEIFALSDDRISLFYENGLAKEFLCETAPIKDNHLVQLLFVGRLVPYKGADMLIEAIKFLPQETKDNIHLTIVGDGLEKSNLVNLVKQYKLENIIDFTGWIQQKETFEYYKKSDLFCFPSIREFGGGVVLEAMACGLPCLVANNGGIGEYVTEDTGFSIEPVSREYLIKELTEKIRILVENKALRDKMSAKCIERAREFEWEQKTQKIVDIYHELIEEKLAGLQHLKIRYSESTYSNLT